MVSEKIIGLIKKLQEMRVDRGCTPSEAAAAACRVQELLQQHQLSIFDVQSQTIEEDILTEDLHTGNRTSSWEGALAVAVSKPHDCQVIKTRKGKESYIRFIGYVSDIEVSKYLFVVLSKTLADMADKQGRELGIVHGELRIFKQSFIMAAANVIYNRLMAERNFSSNDSTCRALVITKDREVKSYVDNNYKNLKQGKCHASLSKAGLVLGERAGKTVALNKGIKGDVESGLQIS